MSEVKNKFVGKWFEKAGNDIKNIENNLSAEDIPTDTICFHAQQAIEKYFKGALVYFEQEISKTHDLVTLMTAISDFIKEIELLEEDLDRITEFAVAARYPDSLYEPTLEEARKSYEIALKVRDIILNRIRNETKE